MTQPASIWPYFVLSGVFLLFSGGIYLIARKFSWKGVVSEGGRHESIDGLRGLLALGVFFHHALINFAFQTSGAWKAPDEPFYAMTGQLGVGFFFMITAFLFWGRILKSESGVDWVALYRFRIRRIVPMYLVAVVVLVLIALSKAAGKSDVQYISVFTNIVRWFYFSFLGAPDINELPRTFTINAGVFWTLAYEWRFYFALPFLAALMSISGRWSVYFLVGFYAALSEEKFLYYFLGGMLVADIHKQRWFVSSIRSWLSDVLFVGVLYVLMTSFDTAYGFFAGVLAMVAFLLILNGGGVFGLLHTKAARLLGEVSYSIYLLHGLVITLFLSVAGSVGFRWTVSNYWPVVLSMGLILVAISVITFRLIERPFIQKTLSVNVKANTPTGFVRTF